MKTKLFFLLTFIVLFSEIFSQFGYYSAVIKYGISSSDINQHQNHAYWQYGNQYSFGIEYGLFASISIQGIVNYSKYDFSLYLDTRNSFCEKTNNAKKSIFDLLFNLKYQYNILFLKAGIGLTSQTAEPVYYQFGCTGESIVVLEDNYSSIVGSMGIGVEFRLLDKIKFILEIETFLRKQTGITGSCGIIYSL